MRPYILLLVCAMFSSSVAAQFDRAIHRTIIDNLVHLELKEPNLLIPGDSMGFIIGSNELVYYVVTAQHSVETVESVVVTPHRSDKSYSATVLNFEGDSRWAQSLDIALLQFKSDKKILFKKTILDTSNLMNTTSVRVVGDYERRGAPRWRLSPEPHILIENDFSNDGREIFRFGHAAQVDDGVSGAPVVSTIGVAGMVRSYERSSKLHEAIGVNEIKRLIDTAFPGTWELTDAPATNDEPRLPTKRWLLGVITVAAAIFAVSQSGGSSSPSEQSTTLRIPSP